MTSIRRKAAGPRRDAAEKLRAGLAASAGGERVIGYDNERGKGDHRHFKGTESPYRFVSIDELLADFVAEVNEERRSS